MSSAQVASVTISGWKRWMQRLLVAFGVAVPAYAAGEFLEILFHMQAEASALLTQYAAEGPLLLFAFQAVVLAPLLETALLVAIVALLKRWRFPMPPLLMMSGSVWILFHLFTGPTALLQCGPFVIFTYGYLRRQQSIKPDGFSVIAIAHALCNGFTCALVAIDPDLHWALI